MADMAIIELVDRDVNAKGVGPKRLEEQEDADLLQTKSSFC